MRQRSRGRARGRVAAAPRRSPLPFLSGFDQPLLTALQDAKKKSEDLVDQIKKLDQRLIESTAGGDL